MNLDTKALEAGKSSAKDELWGRLHGGYISDEEVERAAESAVSAYLAVAQPVTQKLTDAEWQAFQAIPDQGYSHRAWVDARIAERVATVRAEAKREALTEYAETLGYRLSGALRKYGQCQLDGRDIISELRARANQYKENQ